MILIGWFSIDRRCINLGLLGVSLKRFGLFGFHVKKYLVFYNRLCYD